MKKKNSLLFTVLLLIGLFGCQSIEPDVSPDTSNSGLKAAASANSAYSPLFQIYLGKSNQECDAKVNAMVDHFFGNRSNSTDDNRRIYFPVGNNMAYIKDIASNDVRSEGMSYGMMICVQLNMKNEFDRLWTWAKTYMRHTSGENNGFFAWQCRTDGTKIDPNPAPDGEEYFAMALYFAHHRWGGSDYLTSARTITNAMLNNPTRRFFALSGAGQNIVTFSPYVSNTSDPSYHLPAFYGLFSHYANTYAEYMRWNDIAIRSRQFLRTTIMKSPHGLVPDYTDFAGNGKELNAGDGHADFRFDAWRTIMNVTLDATFWPNRRSEYGTWEGFTFSSMYSTKLISFFNRQGISSYGNQFRIDGTPLSTTRSPGLIAMNAVGSRISLNIPLTQQFAQQLWDLPLPTGQFRYYDGCLYMLAMLYCTGNYNIIDPGNKQVIRQ